MRRNLNIRLIVNDEFLISYNRQYSFPLISFFNIAWYLSPIKITNSSIRKDYQRKNVNIFVTFLWTYLDFKFSMFIFFLQFLLCCFGLSLGILEFLQVSSGFLQIRLLVIVSSLVVVELFTKFSHFFLRFFSSWHQILNGLIQLVDHSWSLVLNRFDGFRMLQLRSNIA